jgi:hypothetical protein
LKKTGKFGKNGKFEKEIFERKGNFWKISEKLRKPGNLKKGNWKKFVKLKEKGKFRKKGNL